MTTATESLSPAHRAMLERCAIAHTVIEARGYRSITNPRELARYGFPDFQQRAGLLIPGYGPDGKLNGEHYLRPDAPRVGTDGKVAKYDTRQGSTSRVDVPPTMAAHITDTRVRLHVTEGLKKSDAGASVGLLVASLQGVWNWTGAALQDWAQIPLKGREVWIIFDSDAATNPNVRDAERRLAAFLMSLGARVSIKRIPPGPNGEKQGLDDYLAAGHTPEDMDALPDAEAEETDGEAGEAVQLRAQNARLRDQNDTLSRENSRLTERDALLWRALTNPETREEVPTALGMLRLTNDPAGNPKVRATDVQKLYDPALAASINMSVSTVQRHRKRLKAMQIVPSWTKAAENGHTRTLIKIEREVDVLRRLAYAEPVEGATKVKDGRRRDHGKFRWQCREHPHAKIKLRKIYQCADCGALAERVPIPDEVETRNGQLDHEMNVSASETQPKSGQLDHRHVASEPPPAPGTNQTSTAHSQLDVLTPIYNNVTLTLESEPAAQSAPPVAEAEARQVDSVLCLDCGKAPPVAYHARCQACIIARLPALSQTTGPPPLRSQPRLEALLEVAS